MHNQYRTLFGYQNYHDEGTDALVAEVWNCLIQALIFSSFIAVKFLSEAEFQVIPGKSSYHRILNLNRVCVGDF